MTKVVKQEGTEEEKRGYERANACEHAKAARPKLLPSFPPIQILFNFSGGGVKVMTSASIWSDRYPHPFISSEAGKVKLSASNLDSTPHSLTPQPENPSCMAEGLASEPRSVQCEIWLSAVTDRPNGGDRRSRL